MKSLSRFIAGAALAAATSSAFAADIVDTAAPAAPFKTLVKAVPGQSLTVKANRGGVMVDNAKVVKTDIIATNGAVHVIDTVALPQ